MNAPSPVDASRHDPSQEGRYEVESDGCDHHHQREPDRSHPKDWMRLLLLLLLLRGLLLLHVQHPDEPPAEACCGTPDFPVLLPTAAAADPAAAAAAADPAAPGTPDGGGGGGGGSANELVLGRPLPLISLRRGLLWGLDQTTLLSYDP
ncbi:hypothetical protein CRUP_030129 [Coryphaenoides rupestris]|nr:hypothetical protein CRUP_030129 [Coryphaenoides rupestris]